MFKSILFQLKPKNRKMIHKILKARSKDSPIKGQWSTKSVQRLLFQIRIKDMPKSKAKAISLIKKHPMKNANHFYYDQKNEKIHYISLESDDGYPLETVYHDYMDHNPKRTKACQRIAKILNKKQK